MRCLATAKIIEKNGEVSPLERATITTRIARTSSQALRLELSGASDYAVAVTWLPAPFDMPINNPRMRQEARNLSDREQHYLDSYYQDRVSALFIGESIRINTRTGRLHAEFELNDAIKTIAGRCVAIEDGV